MSDLLLFVLASIGLCHLIVDSTLVAPLKEALGRRGWERLVRMMNCYQCAGFWSGLVVGAVLLLRRWVPFLDLLLYACAASFLGPLGALVIGYLNAAVSTASSSAGQPDEHPAAAEAPRPDTGADERIQVLGNGEPLPGHPEPEGASRVTSMPQ
jgi:hypothetical protein